MKKLIFYILLTVAGIAMTYGCGGGAMPTAEPGAPTTVEYNSGDAMITGTVSGFSGDINVKDMLMSESSIMSVFAVDSDLQVTGGTFNGDRFTIPVPVGQMYGVVAQLGDGSYVSYLNNAFETIFVGIPTGLVAGAGADGECTIGEDDSSISCDSIQIIDLGGLSSTDVGGDQYVVGTATKASFAAAVDIDDAKAQQFSIHNEGSIDSRRDTLGYGHSVDFFLSMKSDDVGATLVDAWGDPDPAKFSSQYWGISAYNHAAATTPTTANWEDLCGGGVYLGYCDEFCIQFPETITITNPNNTYATSQCVYPSEKTGADGYFQFFGSTPWAYQPIIPSDGAYKVRWCKQKYDGRGLDCTCDSSDTYSCTDTDFADWETETINVRYADVDKLSKIVIKFNTVGGSVTNLDWKWVGVDRSGTWNTLTIGEVLDLLGKDSRVYGAGGVGGRGSISVVDNGYVFNETFFILDEDYSAGDPRLRDNAEGNIDLEASLATGPGINFGATTSYKMESRYGVEFKWFRGVLY